MTMASDEDSLKARNMKLAQYLIEAYGKEKELEVALEAHIGMTTRAPYKKRLQEHLKETKAHARLLERRIRKLDHSKGTEAIAKVGAQVNKLVATAKGPLHALRGNSEAEKMLKNAKTEYFSEHEEIATYSAIETLAESVGDDETAKMARQILREERKMATFLEKQIPVLTRAMVKEDLPAKARPAKSTPGGGRKRGGAGKSSSRSGTKRKAASRPTGTRS
jgi:ferritin-like metal-binding protein YciE